MPAAAPLFGTVFTITAIPYFAADFTDGTPHILLPHTPLFSSLGAALD